MKNTIKVGNQEVPQPIQATPLFGSKYYLSTEPCVEKISDLTQFTWADDSWDRMYLKAGVMHKTRRAAFLHIQALEESGNLEEQNTILNKQIFN